jgi:phage terminase large subunit
VSRLTERIERFYEPLRQDIFKFADAMGVDPTHQQAQYFTAVQKGEKRIAVKSGQGTGKTLGSNVATAWRTFRHKDAMSYVTAPTMRQCKDVWLTEFGRMLQNARYPAMRKLFEVTKTRVILGGRENWNIRLVTATKPEAAQGIHEPHLTFVLEEASGIERPFVEQIFGTLTNEDSMMMALGNPNTRDCSFFDFFNSMRDRWCCMTFNSEDSPLTSRAQIQYIIDTYGVDSDVYRVRVKGEFPHMDPNCIISGEWLEKCLSVPIYAALRVCRPGSYGLKPAKQFGIDYARFGSDESVIARRSGHALVELKFYSHVEPKDVNAAALRMQHDAHWSDADTWFCPDANGLGEGVVVDFSRAGKNVHEFKSQHKPVSREFSNKITEAWFSFARKVKNGTVYLPNDRILFKQLTSRQYFITAKGQIEIESKEDYVKRGNESPDRADACVMAFYDEVEVIGQAAGTTGPKIPQSAGR